MTRGGTIRFCDSVVQASTPKKTRWGRKSYYVDKDFKNAIARVAYTAGISIPKALQATQIICDELYNDKFYLSAGEKKEALGLPKEERVESDDVLPSRPTIEAHRGLLAAQQEANTGISLFNAGEDDKPSVYYDTTTRNNVDGDWLSLILEVRGVMYDLRSIAYAYEDRDNIARIIVESLKRIAAAASAALRVDITAKQLWEKITFLSSDAVSKNHFIGKQVAQLLESEHEPIHVLCKSHTAGEGIDNALLSTLQNSLEVPLKLKQQLEEKYSSLRMFFRNTTVVQAGMRALVKLVTPDKSANSCSLSDHFHELCTEQGMYENIYCSDLKILYVIWCISSLISFTLDFIVSSIF